MEAQYSTLTMTFGRYVMEFISLAWIIAVIYGFCWLCADSVAHPSVWVYVGNASCSQKNKMKAQYVYKIDSIKYVDCGIYWPGEELVRQKYAGYRVIL